MVRMLSCLALAGVLSLSLFGTARADTTASPPAPVPQFIPLSEQTAPQLLQQAGLQFQSMNGTTGAPVWKITNPANGPAIEMTLLKNPQGQVVGYRLLASLKMPAPGSLTQADLMRLMQANMNMHPYAYSIDPQIGDLCMLYTFQLNNSNALQVKAVVTGFANQISQTSQVWNNVGQAAPVNPVVQPVNQTVVNANLVNTTWKGTETFAGVKNLTFQFLANGQAFMIDFQTTRPATWTQNGDQVTVSVPSISTTYTGTISGGAFSGQARDHQNGTWTFNLTKAN